MENENKSGEDQKFENELKKLKLTAEHGAKFFKNDDGQLPAPVEAEWLNNILAFEETANKKEVKKIAEILKNPTFPATEGLSDEQLSIALDVAQKLLAKHDICLDSIYGASERELYTFITKEFLDIAVNVIDAPGMVSHFIYEEFYPNDEGDLKTQTKDLINTILSKNFEFLEGIMASKVIHQNKDIECKFFIAQLRVLLEDIEALKLTKLTINTIEIGKAKATVVCSIEYEKKIQPSIITAHQEEAKLGFGHELGYWYAHSISIPDLGI